MGTVLLRASPVANEETQGLRLHKCGVFALRVTPMFRPRCPNPLDSGLQQSVLLPPPPSSQGHVRRFTINTFQFLQDAEAGDQEEVSTSCCGRFLHTGQMSTCG